MFDFLFSLTLKNLSVKNESLVSVARRDVKTRKGRRYRNFIEHRTSNTFISVYKRIFERTGGLGEEDENATDLQVLYSWASSEG